MAEPKIAEKTPAVLELEAGTYYWCRCGESKNGELAVVRRDALATLAKKLQKGRGLSEAR